MKKTDELWRQYLVQGKLQARDELILAYAPLVKYVLGRMAISMPDILDSEDLINCGLIGLMEALGRFDPKRGVKFETFAIPRIKGCIIDQLRALDRIPRHARQKAKEVERAMVKLHDSLGRPPRDDEVAAYMGMELPKYYELLLQVGAVTVSLDGLLDTDEGEAGAVLGDLLEDKQTPDVPTQVENNELLEELVRGLRQLPEREMLLLALHYREGLTMKEIAQVMDISLSRISQLHTKAILRLRAHMQRSGVWPEGELVPTALNQRRMRR